MKNNYNSALGRFVTLVALLMILPIRILPREITQISEQTQQWGEETYGYRLSAEINKLRIHSDEKLELKVTLKNVSDKQLMISKTEDLNDYFLIVKDPKNEILPFKPITPLAQEIYHKLGGPYSSNPIYIMPDKILKVETVFLVNQFYDMRAPGTYSITVKRSIPPHDQKLTYVFSNTIKVEVLK